MYFLKFNSMCWAIFRIDKILIIMLFVVEFNVTFFYIRVFVLLDRIRNLRVIKF